MSRMYSPAQIAIGTYLGGPLAAIYFLKGNFDELKNSEWSKKTVQIGTMISVLLIAVMPFLPDNTPNSLIPILYLVPVILVTKKHLPTKNDIEESSEYSFHSNWKVVGMGLAWLLVYFAIAIIFLMLLNAMGIAELS